MHLKIEVGSSLDNNLEEPCNRTGKRTFHISIQYYFRYFFLTYYNYIMNFVYLFNSLETVEVANISFAV